MKIASVKVSPAIISREKRHVTVSIEFGNERMTVEVVVANELTEDEVQESAIARARDFARRFAIEGLP
jgi:hypothetical protein